MKIVLIYIACILGIVAFIALLNLWVVVTMWILSDIENEYKKRKNRKNKQTEKTCKADKVFTWKHCNHSDL